MRQTIPFADSDHIMSDEMNKAIGFVKDKSLVNVSGEIAMKLKINLKNDHDELFGIY